jgi:protein-disulfide isomerase
VLAATLAMVVCALAACAPGDLAEPRGEAAGALESGAQYADIHQKMIALGELASPVELFVFGDLKSPSCRDFAIGALPAIVDRYVRTGRVRLIFHNLPVVDEQSRRAAHLALAIGMQGRMFQFLDTFFRNQGGQGSGYATDDFLRRVAGTVPGVDVDQAMKNLDDEAVTERLDQAARVAREFRIKATPGFVIGRTEGELRVLHVANPSDPAPFVAAIEALLAGPRPE